MRIPMTVNRQYTMSRCQVRIPAPAINRSIPVEPWDYAMGQAEKGDQVLVAEGSYEFRKQDPDEIITLLSPIVQVAGGYSVDDDFEVQDADKYKTVISGVKPDYAQRLTSKGFISQANAQTPSQG